MKIRDIGWIVVVAGPIAALGLLLISSSVMWRFNEKLLLSELENRFGRETATAAAPMEVSFSEATSTRQSVALAEVLDSASEMEAKYSHVIRFEFQTQTVTPEDQQILDRFLAEYASDLGPMLAALDAIDFEDEPIWMPVEHGRIDAWAGNISLFRTVWRLLYTDIIAAVANNESERAVRSIERVQRISHALLLPQTPTTELVRIQARTQLHEALEFVLPKGDWTPEQLERIDGALAERFPYRESWQAMTQAEQIQAIRKLRGEVTQETNFTEVLQAPSRRRNWLAYRNELERLGTDSPTRLIEAVDKLIEKQATLAGQNRLDTLVSFPFSNAAPYLDQSDNLLASSFMNLENDRKFYRTAVAILRFRDRFGEYPTTLQSLSRIDYPISETISLNQWSFGYFNRNNETRLVIAGRGEKWDGRWTLTETVIEFPPARPTTLSD
ncbi:MAG: hypothetical protein AAFX06_14760 [Planctomycetota bacterium]